MTPPSILLDGSYMYALVTGHEQVIGHYRDLVSQFRLRQRRLLALDVDLARFSDARASVLAPVEAVHVSGQHKNAAINTPSLVPRHLALAAVIVTRENIRRVATIDAGWLQFDTPLDFLGATDSEDHSLLPAGYVPFQSEFG